jgi:putative MFS transporter
MKTAAYTLDTMPYRMPHFRILLYTLLGHFTGGYLIGVVSLALPSITTEMNMSAFWQGMIGSAPLMGILLGSIIWGRLSDNIGRRQIYLWHFVIIVVVSIAQFFVSSAELLFALRLILGLCVGAEMVVGMAYLSESVPARYRGMSNAAQITSWLVGGLISFIICYAMIDMGSDNWRWMLASSAAPGAFALLLGIGIPESIRWLVRHGKTDRAREGAEKFFGSDVSIHNLIDDFQNRCEPDKKAPLSAVFSKRLRRRTLFGGIFWACHVLPFYAIYTYAPTALESLGVTDSYLSSIFLNVFTVVGSLFGLFILERMRRRMVLIGSYVFFALPLTILGLAANMPGVWVTILFCVTLFSICVCTNLENVYPPELFPTEVRSTGVGFVVTFSRVGAILGAFAMPMMMESAGISITMLIIAAIVVFGLFISIMWAPETRGINLEKTLELDK